MASDASPLELREVTSGYGDVAVIRGVSMDFPKGLITTIVGSNGAGKSTAIKVAAGLLRAWQGNIFVQGRDITREAADRRVYRGIAYVPQGRIVVPEMSVRDNLMIGAHILGGNRVAIETATERVMQLFPALKSRMKQQADTMSGGEQQMLAIGRALMTSPETIMLDEPSLGLSPKFVDIVFEKLLSLRDARNDGGDGRAEGVACARHLRPRLCDASRAGRLPGRRLGPARQRRRQTAVPWRNSGKHESPEFCRCMKNLTRPQVKRRFLPSMRPSARANRCGPSCRRRSNGPPSRKSSRWRAARQRQQYPALARPGHRRRGQERA